MTGYDFHPEAEIDLDDIWEFISQDTLRAADKVTEDILSALSALVSSPHMGHWRPRLTSRPVRFWRGTRLPHRLRI